MEVHDLMAQAIDHAINAGACRRAAIHNPDQADLWTGVAETEREKASALLARFVERSGRWRRPGRSVTPER